MGMAASQARYLALVARKSNCEYEGQQINQARLNLSNQTANLFNQMLGLNVPIPPSTSDYTKTQYSFSDGVNAVTLDTWKQLAERDENYNYVVTYHYNADVYTGSQKKLNDPQVQFTYPSMDISSDYATQVALAQKSLTELNAAKEAYETAKTNYQSLVKSAKNMSTYVDKTDYTNISAVAFSDTGTYTITYNKTETDAETNIKYYKYKGNDNKDYLYKDGNYYFKQNSSYLPAIPLTALKNSDGTQVTVTGGDSNNYDVYTDSNGTKYYYKSNIYYSDVSGATPTALEDGVYAAAMTPDTTTASFKKYSDTDTAAKTALETLKKNGAIEDIDYTSVYVLQGDSSGGATFAYYNDLEALIGRSGTQTYLPVYNYGKEPAEGEAWQDIKTVDENLASAQTAVNAAKSALDLAQLTYDSLNIPDYVGNCKLTQLAELTDTQAAEIKQVIKDMNEQEVSTSLSKYYNIDDGTYTGGIYQFTLNNITYYVTYDDLADSAKSGTGINHIDDQQKLAYYRADYVTQKIEKTEKALLETDSQGRFSSIRLEDDTIKYTLNVETITDDVAYQDAMNKYYYENAQYDKMVQDINAKTSLIHQEDRTLELRLKQLDTEQNALSQEMEAVQKVVKDNVEKSFKTFNN